MNNNESSNLAMYIHVNLAILLYCKNYKGIIVIALTVDLCGKQLVMTWIIKIGPYKSELQELSEKVHHLCY